MTSLELKKIKVELLRVSAAKAEVELRIEEYMDNIKRLQDNIAISEAKEQELQLKIAEAIVS
jgi:predicted  nucleic acid-binding Zn-ribbon protein